MVRDVFRLAKENSPAIIFIDEIDAIATKRFDAQTGADREVQRILLELLNQMDGFDQTTNVKVIMATNRADTLDPALLRPGRLDRKIEFPLPDRRQKRLVFSTITSRMNLSEEVDLEDYVARPDRISGADINAICQEVSNRIICTRLTALLHSGVIKSYWLLKVNVFCILVPVQIMCLVRFMYCGGQYIFGKHDVFHILASGRIRGPGTFLVWIFVSQQRLSVRLWKHEAS